jgi:hypothetical protein
MQLQISTFLFICLTNLLQAQPSKPMVPGDYYINVREMASAIRFNPDGTFEFFFIYGSVDREGKGTWIQDGENLLLNSPAKQTPDFILKEAKHTEADQLVIQVSDANAMILRYVQCRVKTATGDLDGGSDESGKITFGKTPVQEIALLHELWPNEPTVFKVADPTFNYFAFTISPSIVQVVFKDLILQIKDDHNLEGAHPLMRGSFSYARQ